MAYNTPAEIISVIAPEFTEEDNISGAIEIADMQISNKIKMRAGERISNLLISYLACHLLTIANRYKGASAAISSVTEGETTISYSLENKAKKTNAPGLSDTTYGKEYSRILMSYEQPFYIDGM